MVNFRQQTFRSWVRVQQGEKKKPRKKMAREEVIIPQPLTGESGPLVTNCGCMTREERGDGLASERKNMRVLGSFE